MNGEKIVPWLILATVLGVEIPTFLGGAPQDEAIEVSRAASAWRAENEERLQRLDLLERENLSLRAQNLQLLELLDGATLAVEVPE